MTFGGVSFFKAFTLQAHDRLQSNGLIWAGVTSYVLQVLSYYISNGGEGEGGKDRDREIGGRGRKRVY